MERRMDNRLGERTSIQLAIRLVSTRPRTIGFGLLKNLSRSGALIVNCDLQLYSLIHVVFKSRPGLKQDDESVSAYVTRVGDDGIGVEWCEYAPPAVAELLQTVIASSAPAERQIDPVAAEVPSAVALLSYAS
jgi:hypothetical protein